MAPKLSPAQRALLRDLQRYKAHTARQLILALVLAGVGVMMVFFFSPSPDGPKTGWLYDNFGEQGQLYGAKIFGVLAFVVAAWVFVGVRRRMTVGVRTLEERSRKVLDLPPEEPRPGLPQTTINGLILLGSMLALIALYYLFQWITRGL